MRRLHVLPLTLCFGISGHDRRDCTNAAGADRERCAFWKLTGFVVGLKHTAVC